MMELKGYGIVCSKCLILDSFFIGGGSWSPDRCPKCNGTDCILIENLSANNKRKANAIYREMWKKKWK